MTERYSLAKERIEEIITESKGLGIYSPFFESLAIFTKGLLLMLLPPLFSNGKKKLAILFFPI